MAESEMKPSTNFPVSLERLLVVTTPRSAPNGIPSFDYHDREKKATAGQANIEGTLIESLRQELVDCDERLVQAGQLGIQLYVENERLKRALAEYEATTPEVTSAHSETYTGTPVNAPGSRVYQQLRLAEGRNLALRRHCEDLEHSLNESERTAKKIREKYDEMCSRCLVLEHTVKKHRESSSDDQNFLSSDSEKEHEIQQLKLEIEMLRDRLQFSRAQNLSLSSVENPDFEHCEPAMTSVGVSPFASSVIQMDYDGSDDLLEKFHQLEAKLLKGKEEQHKLQDALAITADELQSSRRDAVRYRKRADHFQSQAVSTMRKLLEVSREMQRSERKVKTRIERDGCQAIPVLRSGLCLQLQLLEEMYEQTTSKVHGFYSK